jgi:hypothetical protein
MELHFDGFDGSIDLVDLCFDAGTAIETNIAIIATGGVVGLLFFEAMDFTELAGPTIGAVTAVFGIVTAGTTMNTKKDSLESIPFTGVGADIGRLVLARPTRVDIRVINGFRTIADLFGSLRATF